MAFLKTNRESHGPDDDFWYTNLRPPTVSGEIVTPDSAMRLSAVYSCVKLLSDTIAALPIRVRRHVEGGYQDLPKHPLWNLLRFRPNKLMDSITWRKVMQTSLELRGVAYSEIVFDRGGNASSLMPINPDNVQIQTFGRRTDIRYVVQDGTVQRIIPRSRMFRVMGLTHDGIHPINPIEAEREVIGYGLAGQRYGSAFYKNNPHMAGWIEAPPGASFKDEEQKKAFQRSWRAAHTGNLAFNTPILEKGMKFNGMSIKHTDMQYLETTKKSQLDIAQIFRVPPRKLYLSDKSNLGSFEQEGLDFVADSILPRLVAWEQAIWTSLFDADEQEDMDAEFELDALLRAESEKRFTGYQSAINTGWMVRNEARKKEGLNPIDGLDEPLTPMNMAESVGGVKQGPVDQRKRAMVVANAKRCAVKIADKMGSLKLSAEDAAKWVSTVMMLPFDMCHEFCVEKELQVRTNGSAPENWEHKLAGEIEALYDSL
jgi:HK97 family phage portal protein